VQSAVWGAGQVAGAVTDATSTVPLPDEATGRAAGVATQPASANAAAVTSKRAADEAAGRVKMERLLECRAMVIGMA